MTDTCQTGITSNVSMRREFKHDCAAPELETVLRFCNGVQIFAAQEDRQCAFRHGAENREICAGFIFAIVRAQQFECADHVAICMRLKDICCAQCGNAIVKHACASAIDKADRQVAIKVFTACDLVHAIGGEKRRPFFEPVVVYGMGVLRQKILQARTQICIGIVIENGCHLINTPCNRASPSRNRAHRLP